jgi:ADP-heptose:LPS heptosyltransferase
MKQIRILISRPDRIGDVVLSTPIPREIKKKYADSFIAVMLRPYTKDIYLNNPYVDKIILYDQNDKKISFWNMVKEIRDLRFTHALMLLPNEKINWLLFFSGIKTRIGVGHKLFQFLTFTKYVSRNKYIPLRHEADYCMDLARKIGVETNNLECEIFLTNDEKEIVQEKRKYFAPGNEFIIGIHTSSGNSSPNWKPGEYLKLIKQLKSFPNSVIIVTDNIPDKILDDIDDIKYPNKDKTLREAILNFAALDLLISASTGPMHIAAALKTRTLSLFCPMTACSPKLWGPLGNDSRVVLPKENYCKTKCPGDPKICSFTGEEGINYMDIFAKVVDYIRK